MFAVHPQSNYETVHPLENAGSAICASGVFNPAMGDCFSSPA